VRALLAHELAHLRRHDYLVNLCQCVVEAVMFYHPAAWWISRRIRQERECACDELAAAVVGDRRIVAEALVTLAEREMAGFSIALGAGGGSLSERVQRLLRQPAPGPVRSGLGFSLSLLASFALGAAALWWVQHPRAMAPGALPSPAPTVSRGEVLLREQLDRLDAQIHEQQKRVDDLAVELSVPDAVVEKPQYPAGLHERTDLDLARRRFELGLRIKRSQDELKRLRALPSEELRVALQISRPTPILQTLTSDLAIAEQHRAALLSDRGTSHPEVERVNRQMEKIRTALEEVVAGTLGTLEHESEADVAELAQIELQISRLPTEQAALVSRYHPYRSARQQLDTLKRMREAMEMQITMEAINTAVSRSISGRPPASP